MKENYCEILMIIDRSGSMTDVQSDAIGGFNTFLKEQQNLPGEALLSLVLFDNEYIEFIKSIDIHHVEPLNNKTYVPRGTTALLDAIGRGINSLGERLNLLKEEERPEKVIVGIITDGYENASHEFSKDRIKEIIDCQSDTYNWEFIFLGANMDAVGEGTSLGIACSLGYTGNGKGTQDAYKKISRSISAYRSK